MKPIRIQMQRTRGWRKPENTVVVARPSRWGNPYAVIGKGQNSKVAPMTAEMAVAAYRVELVHAMDLIPGLLEPLRGKNLGCWCKVGAPCHGDVLLELACQPVGEP